MKPWAGSVYNLSIMGSLHFIFNVKRYQTKKNRLRRVNPRMVRENNGEPICFSSIWLIDHRGNEFERGLSGAV